MRSPSHAEAIAKTLGRALRSANGWLTLCPAHDDHTPSLSIADGDNGKLLVKCFAGCKALDILAALRQRGLLDSSQDNSAFDLPSNREADKVKLLPSNWALDIWQKSLPAAGTPVETYLRNRGYIGPIPFTLRYHPRLFHRESGRHFPAMIGGVAVAPDKKIVAAHRTYLQADGYAKAEVDNTKKSLGPISGGAVRLAPVTETLAITEGIETGLSVMQATRLPTWAALSAGGIETLQLPPLPRAVNIVICADHDASGRGQLAAQTAAQKWMLEGRKVRIAMPPQVGTDFNDMLQECKR